MTKNVVDTAKRDINELGHPQYDNRLKRITRAINGYRIIHPYLDFNEDVEPKIQEKYREDWGRMYATTVKVCSELEKDKFSRRAVIFNTTKYQDHYPCFLTMQILHNSGGEYDAIVYQRSSDLEKLQDDIHFFEAIMHKIRKRTKLNVNRLIIHFGSIHYQTKE